MDRLISSMDDRCLGISRKMRLPPGTQICSLKDLANGKGKGFTFGDEGFPFSIFVVRKDELVRAFVNECPHTGVQLNWSPDDFTSEDGSLIICSTHGALFELENGYCSFGPCIGENLEQIPWLTQSPSHGSNGD